MTKEIFTPDFIQNLMLILVPVIIGAIALWTWQRAYWEYQLKRQREDWVLRQCYDRRDSQRIAKETLIVEMNETLEKFITATILCGSAIQRRDDYINQGGTQQGIQMWNKEVEKSTDDFNNGEKEWMIQARVIFGKINFVFPNSKTTFSKSWENVIDKSLNTCSLFHQPKWSYANVLNSMNSLRDEKDKLIETMQFQIDSFVERELEPGKKK